MGQELGTNHIGYWVNEATSQAEWGAWGYFLQGNSPRPRRFPQSHPHHLIHHIIHHLIMVAARFTTP
jgi:hypothetical protein